MDLIKDLTSFITTKKRPVLIILGPTASGKTNFSIKLAKILNAEIISTDSRQIYKEMDIATAVVREDEMQGIKHHLIKFRKPDNPLTLAEYKDLASQKIEEIFKAKKIPILVGGTGLYISALIENYEIPRVKPNEKLRKELEKEAKEFGKLYVYNKLEKLDKDTAKDIHPNNLRYVIRAIEINLDGKHKKIDKKSAKNNYDTFIISIKMDREKLYERINKRTDLMIENGLVEEVKGLIEKGYDEKLPSISSVGVKEIIPYINGEISKEDAIETHKRNSRRYAKRQLTWFKRYKDVREINPEELEEFIKSIKKIKNTNVTKRKKMDC